jgi:6-pyruvoyl-tetrahydropterin synthase
MPYTVRVRDRCMYSHSLKFGDDAPFRTGCTAVVDATFTGPTLTADGVLVDITVAQAVLREVLAKYDHADLDNEPDFAGKNTTVEVVAAVVHAHFVASIKHRGWTGAPVTRFEIEVKESDVAAASYFTEGTVF